MYEDARSFVDALGGYRLVAGRLKVSATTVHTHIQAGVLPAKWYSAAIQLAGEKEVEPPPRSLFSFMALPTLDVVQPSQGRQAEHHEKDAA